MSQMVCCGILLREWCVSQVPDGLLQKDYEGVHCPPNGLLPYIIIKKWRHLTAQMGCCRRVTRKMKGA